MQIVHAIAKIDAYKYAKKRTWTPTKEYLFNTKITLN